MLRTTKETQHETEHALLQDAYRLLHTMKLGEDTFETWDQVRDWIRQYVRLTRRRVIGGAR